MAVTASLKSLMLQAKSATGDDRVLLLAVIGELAEQLAPTDAAAVASFLVDQLSSAHDAGKIAVLSAVTELARKFGSTAPFRRFMETYENELGLCIIGTNDPSVLRFTRRALESRPPSSDAPQQLIIRRRLRLALR